MESKLRIALLAAAALVGVAAVSWAQPPKAATTRPARERAGARADCPDRQMQRQEMLEKYDTNKDGQLSPEERAAARQERGGHGRRMRHGFCPVMLQKYDANGDGKLDETERAAAKEAWQKKRAEYDKDGDGKLNKEERQAFRKDMAQECRAAMLEKYDTNKDGQLSPEERQAAKEQWRQRRSATQPAAE